MKRSEFKRRHIEQGTANDAIEAERAASLAEEAGVQWDPEEPKLPGRLTHKNPVALRCGAPRGLWDAETGEWVDEKVHAEAAACYNVLRSLTEGALGDQSQFSLHYLRQRLQDERENLR